LEEKNRATPAINVIYASLGLHNAQYCPSIGTLKSISELTLSVSRHGVVLLTPVYCLR